VRLAWSGPLPSCLTGQVREGVLDQLAEPLEAQARWRHIGVGGCPVVQGSGLGVPVPTVGQAGQVHGKHKPGSAQCDLRLVGLFGAASGFTYLGVADLQGDVGHHLPGPAGLVVGADHGLSIRPPDDGDGRAVGSRGPTNGLEIRLDQADLETAGFEPDTVPFEVLVADAFLVEVVMKSVQEARDHLGDHLRGNGRGAVGVIDPLEQEAQVEPIVLLCLRALPDLLQDTLNSVPLPDLEVACEQTGRGHALGASVEQTTEHAQDNRVGPTVVQEGQSLGLGHEVELEVADVPGEISEALHHPKAGQLNDVCCRVSANDDVVDVGAVGRNEAHVSRNLHDAGLERNFTDLASVEVSVEPIEEDEGRGEDGLGWDRLLAVAVDPLEQEAQVEQILYLGGVARPNQVEHLDDGRPARDADMTADALGRALSIGTTFFLVLIEWAAQHSDDARIGTAVIQEGQRLRVGHRVEPKVGIDGPVAAAEPHDGPSTIHLIEVPLPVHVGDKVGEGTPARRDETDMGRNTRHRNLLALWAGG